MGTLGQGCKGRGDRKMWIWGHKQRGHRKMGHKDARGHPPLPSPGARSPGAAGPAAPAAGGATAPAGPAPAQLRGLRGEARPGGRHPSGPRPSTPDTDPRVPVTALGTDPTRFSPPLRPRSAQCAGPSVPASPRAVPSPLPPPELPEGPGRAVRNFWGVRD